ncbi:hypothetical protein SS50377_27331 [Spironucleus salmonicida]|uniref:Uncharacterized protein n=1 Tax=Spironucleus salmonicida TaxID=348837 RepID=V6LGE5_9EUKA|nr:hypothetical protein SS50377_27331 [Spironucleus salmonicida]|eukprot:EST43368.1 hypothetical protein SS50377_17048 [Spironucleus salmonicida]
MQAEISKLLQMLFQLGYPQQLIQTHQQTLSPPSDYDLATQTLLNIIRYLLTNSVPVFVSYIKKMNPQIHDNRSLITTFYQSINYLKYIPKVAPEAFIDQFPGGLENYQDLHNERVRLVRIFCKLLIQLQQKWGNISSEKLRGHQDFTLLLPNSNQTQQNMQQHYPQYNQYQGAGFQPPQFQYPQSQLLQMPNNQQQHYLREQQQQQYQPFIPVYPQSINPSQIYSLTKRAVDPSLSKQVKRDMNNKLMIPIDLIPEDIQERLRKQFLEKRQKKSQKKHKVQHIKKQSKRHESYSDSSSEESSAEYPRKTQSSKKYPINKYENESDTYTSSESNLSDEEYTRKRHQKKVQKQKQHHKSSKRHQESDSYSNMESESESSYEEKNLSRKSKKHTIVKQTKQKRKQVVSSSESEECNRKKSNPKQLYKQDKDLDKYIDDKYKNQYNDRKETELQHRYQTALDQTPEDLTLQSKSVPDQNISNILNATYEKDPELARTQRINDLINKSQVKEHMQEEDIINKYLGQNPVTISPDDIDKQLGIVGKSVTIDDEPSVIIGNKMYDFIEPPSNIANQQDHNQVPSYDTNTLMNQQTYPQNQNQVPLQPNILQNNFEMPQSVSEPQIQYPVQNQFLQQPTLPTEGPLNIYTENTPYPPQNQANLLQHGDLNNLYNQNKIPIQHNDILTQNQPIPNQFQNNNYNIPMPDMFDQNYQQQLNQSKTPYDITTMPNVSQIPTSQKDLFTTGSVISQAQTTAFPVNSAYESVPEQIYKSYNIQTVSPPRQKQNQNQNYNTTLPGTQLIQDNANQSQHHDSQTPQVRTEEILHVLETEDFIPQHRESSQISKVDNLAKPNPGVPYVSSSQSNSSNQGKIDQINPVNQLFSNSYHESAPQTDQFVHIQPNFSAREPSQPQNILKKIGSEKNIFDFNNNENFDSAPGTESSISNKHVSFDRSQLPDPSSSSSGKAQNNVFTSQNPNNNQTTIITSQTTPKFDPITHQNYTDNNISDLPPNGYQASNRNPTNSFSTSNQPQPSQPTNIYLPSSSNHNSDASTTAQLPEVEFKSNFPIYRVQEGENLPEISIQNNSMKSADLTTSHLPKPSSSSSSSYKEIVKTIAESLTSSARILNEMNENPTISTLRAAQTDRNMLFSTERALKNSRISFTESSLSARRENMKSELEELKKSELLLMKSKSQRQKIESSEVSNTARLQALLQKGKSLLKDMSEIGSIQFSGSESAPRERSYSKRSSLQSSNK